MVVVLFGGSHFSRWVLRLSISILRLGQLARAAHSGVGMDRISYIFGYSADDKQICTYTYNSAVGNFSYWCHVGAVNELFHALGEDIQSFTGEHDDDQRLPYF